MRKRRPIGWRGEPYRHSLARRGILTAHGRKFSDIKNADDYQDFLSDEQSDISRRRIADARFQVSRDRRDLKRLKDIDIRILHAIENGEMDLAEILIDAQNSDNQLRAGGILQNLREKIIPSKITASSPPQERINAYYNWYQKELDKRNKKLAKAPNKFNMDEIENKFNIVVQNKQTSLGLLPEDVEEIEAEARQYMTLYQPSERTQTQRERAVVHPVGMRSTSAVLSPRITDRFNEASLGAEFSEGEYSILDKETSRRDLSIDAMGSSSLDVQKDVRGSLSKDHTKIQREYLQELKQNRNLRMDIGDEMDEEWKIREDELRFRENMINNAERALVAGGIAIPAGLLGSLASGIISSLGNAPTSQVASLTPKPSPSSDPHPMPPVSNNYIKPTIQPKGGI